MVYSLTYNDLVNQITNYCVRVGDTDFANEIPFSAIGLNFNLTHFHIQFQLPGNGS